MKKKMRAVGMQHEGKLELEDKVLRRLEMLLRGLRELLGRGFFVETFYGFWLFAI